MIKIGERELVFSSTFNVLDEQEVKIDVMIGGEEAKLSLRFTNDATASPNFVQWTAVENRLLMVFKNWKIIGASAFPAPQKIGTFGGKPVAFQMSHTKIAEIHLINFQLLHGD